MRQFPYLSLPMCLLGYGQVLYYKDLTASLNKTNGTFSNLFHMDFENCSHLEFQVLYNYLHIRSYTANFAKAFQQLWLHILTINKENKHLLTLN